ncbi:hypothetical protein AAMO2058_000036100 [Amorphochlora amoebiformis]|mmetsp:Transcript_8478/g.13292  ORF Transcript_8478/g.13292 Transcript_8478/m.13292 type:complete len:190 (-) Transcript_8478:115-684(-)|eukprot:1394941-Amorphochlora_amoeboformis.AAC.1
MSVSGCKRKIFESKWEDKPHSTKRQCVTNPRDCKLCCALRRDRRKLRRSESKRTLEIDYWKRTEECSKRKKKHMEKIEQDGKFSMEDWVMNTTLKHSDHAMEKNLFPYKTPDNIEHWTLWAIHDMDCREIERFMRFWIKKEMPNVVAWEYDENSHRSIDIFHVHVYLEFKPTPKKSPDNAEFETPPRQH